MRFFEHFSVLQIALAIIHFSSYSIAQQYLRNNYPADVIEDAGLDTEALLRKYKYPVETHYVTTADNYVLGMHRMPNPKGRAVLLMHGLTDNSATWIFMGPQKGLGYLLHDMGYDVWMGNVRGNRYSRNHTSLNPDTDGSFWDFSWHEIGYYDLPAMLDYVLQKTQHAKLAYFGHSQGTTSFFVMCSMRPQYNHKISIMFAMAPVAFSKHMKATQLLSNNPFGLKQSSKQMAREVYARNLKAEQPCFMSKIAMDACLTLYWQLLGKNPKQLNMTMLPVICGHAPAGCSYKQVNHYIQLVALDRFCQYDYGAKENQKRYGQTTPPDYPLDKITAPVGLYYVSNDNLASTIDVRRLAKSLGNVVADNLYPYSLWNHMDLLWAIDAREMVHIHLIEVLKQRA